MAPQITPLTYNQPPPAGDTQTAAWCIPFLAFYAFGVLASMTMTWAAAKYSKRSFWPPTSFRNGDRSGPLYRLVLYLPALIWLPLLAAGILYLLGCGLLHLWRWLVRKLSSASGSAGRGDGVSLRIQTDGDDQVPLRPVGKSLASATKDDTVQVGKVTDGVAIGGEGAPRSTPANKELTVNVHHLPATGKNIRQDLDEDEERS